MSTSAAFTLHAIRAACSKRNEINCKTAVSCLVKTEIKRWPIKTRDYKTHVMHRHIYIKTLLSDRVRTIANIGCSCRPSRQRDCFARLIATTRGIRFGLYSSFSYRYRHAICRHYFYEAANFPTLQLHSNVQVERR